MTIQHHDFNRSHKSLRVLSDAELQRVAPSIFAEAARVMRFADS